MKTLNHLLVAAAAVVTLNATFSAQAGQPLLSPKAKALADSLRKVPGTTPDMIDRSVKVGSPKAIALAESLRKVPSTGQSIDLVHVPRPTLSPKDPRFEMAWRQNAVKEFQIAPLK
jgi:hypothetical protein